MIENILDTLFILYLTTIIIDAKKRQIGKEMLIVNSVISSLLVALLLYKGRLFFPLILSANIVLNIFKYKHKLF